MCVYLGNLLFCLLEIPHSNALLCEYKAKTKAQRVPTQQWKDPASMHPSGDRGRFGKYGMVRTVCLGYCLDSGSGTSMVM